MVIPGFLKSAFQNAFYSRLKRMRSYIENGVENVIVNVIGNVIENVISDVIENFIENAFKTVALLTPLKTAQLLIKKFKFKQQKQNFIQSFSCMEKTCYMYF
jgi:pentose-5-phosphate-3-epimerase